MIAKNTVAQSVAGCAAECRRQGVKATHQRMEILRELTGTRAHPNAETVHRRVRRRIPAISLDTVYRTLRMFESKGLVSRVATVKDCARYDADTAPHHHFICSECGLIADFQCDELNVFTPPPAIAALGHVDSLHVELRGKCKKCRAP